MVDTSEFRERLVRVEATLERIDLTVRETRDQAQVTVGLVESLKTLQERQMRTDEVVTALLGKVEPLLHSTPPITVRLREIEDTLLAAKTRDRVWRTIATFVSPLLTAMLVAYFTGGMR